MHKLLFISGFFLPIFCLAQNPLGNLADGLQSRFSDDQPVINYTLIADSADLSRLQVQMRLENISDTFRLAFYSHPLADDKYWRYVENLAVSSDGGKAASIREDSALWKIITHHHRAAVTYKIHLPQIKYPRTSSRPFLTPFGGLVGDYHCFMYVVGQSLSPCYIHFRIPAEWQIATGLEPSADPFTFYASSAGILLDAPVLIGHFKKWQFQVDGVPHTVAYWSLPDGASFDTLALVSNLQKIVTEAGRLFGRLPYREYFFLLQDRSVGALEHNNSVTVGMPSKVLAKNVFAYNGDVAHEYFHAWNMMRIVPAEYAKIDFKPPHFAKSLWWSEGLTMFYADLLQRRAGILHDTTTRLQHLESLIEEYINNPGNHTFSAEKVSMSDIAPPGYLGDYDASTHLQGELIGNLLDMVIRNGTNGKRDVDDLMRIMFEDFGGKKGFNGRDVEQVAGRISHDEFEIHSLFENYIRGNKRLDFDKYLKLLGLRMNTTSQVLMGDDQKPAADEAIYAWSDAGSHDLKLGIVNPEGSWGKAGLHTGDVLMKINDSTFSSANDFYSWLNKLHVGDTVRIEVERKGKITRTKLYLTPQEVTIVRLERVQKPSAKQEALYLEWIEGR